MKKAIDKILNTNFAKVDSKRKYDKTRKRVLLTLNEQELQEIKEASEKAKMKPSVFVKELTLCQIHQNRFLSKDLESQLNEACLHLKRIGSNINQISRKINTEGIAEKEEVKQALSLINSLENFLISKVTKF